MIKITAGIDKLNDHIPNKLRSIVLLTIVGFLSFSAYSVVAVILNILSQSLHYDFLGMIYFLMFLINLILYWKIGKQLYSGRQFGSGEKRLNMLAAVGLLLALQGAAALTGSLPAAFLAAWVGGFGYFVLYFYSFFAISNSLILILSYLGALLIPLLFIYSFCN
ncbi:hypothetical protein [Holdemania filiformis]|uniref:hypothetical protein n=1 Tax=Holdemania filiformis TaxID=61171 RepID=UPI00266F395C|nr:hypothetical protein [Holdemania filiformis]